MICYCCFFIYRFIYFDIYFQYICLMYNGSRFARSNNHRMCFFCCSKCLKMLVCALFMYDLPLYDNWTSVCLWSTCYCRAAVTELNFTELKFVFVLVRRTQRVELSTSSPRATTLLLNTQRIFFSFIIFFLHRLYLHEHSISILL